MTVTDRRRCRHEVDGTEAGSRAEVCVPGFAPGVAMGTAAVMANRMGRPERPPRPGPTPSDGGARGWWLAVDGRPVAAVELAADARSRRRGLLGRTGLESALLLAPAPSVHTVGMRFPIDVALCRPDSDDVTLVVDAVRTLSPGRATRPRLRARVVVEAEAGAFARWGLRPGARLTVVVSEGGDRRTT